MNYSTDEIIDLEIKARELLDESLSSDDIHGMPNDLLLACYGETFDYDENYHSYDEVQNYKATRLEFMMEILSRMAI